MKWYYFQNNWAKYCGKLLIRAYKQMVSFLQRGLAEYLFIFGQEPVVWKRNGNGCKESNILSSEWISRCIKSINPIALLYLKNVPHKATFLWLHFRKRKATHRSPWLWKGGSPLFDPGRKRLMFSIFLSSFRPPPPCNLLRGCVKTRQRRNVSN